MIVRSTATLSKMRLMEVGQLSLPCSLEVRFDGPCAGSKHRDVELQTIGQIPLCVGTVNSPCLMKEREARPT